MGEYTFGCQMSLDLVWLNTTLCVEKAGHSETLLEPSRASGKPS